MSKSLDGELGIWHLANLGSVTWADLAGLVADLASVPRQCLVQRRTADLHLAAAPTGQQAAE